MFVCTVDQCFNMVLLVMLVILRLCSQLSYCSLQTKMRSLPSCSVTHRPDRPICSLDETLSRSLCRRGLCQQSYWTAPTWLVDYHRTRHPPAQCSNAAYSTRWSKPARATRPGERSGGSRWNTRGRGRKLASHQFIHSYRYHRAHNMTVRLTSRRAAH